ncbi:hypothetical protein [Haloferula sargassicola]|uniref:Uncharacterized protein n=1 Tax=Haloferula sargassicola TaxID=490096 RepID=A0ABP9UP09_9BACT
MNSIPKARRMRESGGFALVAALMLMVLLGLLSVAVSGLAAVGLQGSQRVASQAQARAQARLALMLAVGQLQKELGPDQRVCASDAVVNEASRTPHRIGVWSTVASDGLPWVRRDPETGAWTDLRASDQPDPAAEVSTWLDSGLDTDPVTLVGLGSVDLEGDTVKAGRVGVDGVSKGRIAWWTGDLGSRADLSVADEREPDEEPASLMLSQQADARMLAEDGEWDERMRGRLVTQKSGQLVAGRDRAKDRYFDYATGVFGVLADAKHGGLRRDLTAYLAGRGEGSVAGRSPLLDSTPMVDDREGSRWREGAPTFGLLRSWAENEVALAGAQTPVVPPPTDGSRRDGQGRTLCNDLPVRLRERMASGLQPVLVEASNFMQLSVYEDPPDPRTGAKSFRMRTHQYPRVVLWNPYAVAIEMHPAIVMIQGNGRQEVWTENIMYSSSGRELPLRTTSQWLFFEGGRSTAFGDPANSGNLIMETEGYNDPYMGSYYYSVPKTEFGPGECLVFSPARSAEYNGLSTYRPGPYDLSANELSCEVPPDVSRSFYISASDINGGLSYRPAKFWFQTTPYWSQGGRQGVENQGEDTRAIMKALDGSGAVTFEKFDQLPLISYLSASLQFGEGREPRIAWDERNPMPMEKLEATDPRPTLVPDVRTRDGMRMRWFDEHPSNLLNSGALNAFPEHFQEAILANWNPRAAYAVRSPWENLAGTLPTSGNASGPWFFGAYTRDLYDEAVSWEAETPVFRDGRYHGNPFGQPQEGEPRYVLFDLPRQGVGVVSLAQFQNARLSEFVWHPSCAVGNSLADPRLGLDGLKSTVPSDLSEAAAKWGGFHADAIGWSSDSERSESRDSWAATGRALLQELPEDEPVVYDLSFEANEALWDRYFLSTGDSSQKASFFANPSASPLPNGRMRLFDRPADGASDLEDLDLAARHLMVAGAFNVNSTRVEAWRALFASARSEEQTGTPFVRFLDPPGDEVTSATDRDAWSGRRVLTDDEIDRLAEAVVEEVRARGPFLSLADFVNRRLVNDEHGRKGALQAAIDQAGINASFNDRYPLENDRSLGDYRHPDGIDDATRLEQTLKPASKAWGAPGFLTQADLLQAIGPVLSVRSDTFVVRAYGEALDAAGKVTARAWCEAQVQRTPVPIAPDADGLDSDDQGEPQDFGRRFDVVSFRWLNPDEV